MVMQFGGGGPRSADRLARIDVHGSAAYAETTPGVWNDIDLFGYPAEEVLPLLPAPAAVSDNSAWRSQSIRDAMTAPAR